VRKGLFRAARWRLVAWNVTVFTGVLIVLGLAVYRAFSANVYTNLDDQLSRREQYMQQQLPLIDYNEIAFFRIPKHNWLFNPPYRIVTGDSTGFVEYNPTECPFPEVTVGPSPCYGDALQPASQEGIYAALKGGADLRTDTFLKRGPERVLTFTVINAKDQIEDVIQISADASGEESALQTVRLLLIFGGILGVILAFLGSIFLANRALVPIRQAFQRQRQFTADASHELRTPLSLIRANAEMLTRHGDRFPEGDSELVGEIIRETDHLARLVGDLLTLARSDTENLKLTVKPVDFRALVSAVHDDLHLVAEAQGITTSLNLDGPLTVQGDETRLRQLLLILLDNALKYTDTGGRVDVSVGQAEKHARLVVADTGVGIPAHDLPYIFDRFYRVDGSRNHENGGTGLGLAIARWIVQAHHGTIKVESEQGKGAKFQVELPV
jgi:signal transduction histidine kinase